MEAFNSIFVDKYSKLSELNAKIPTPIELETPNSESEKKSLELVNKYL